MGPRSIDGVANDPRLTPEGYAPAPGTRAPAIPPEATGVERTEPEQVFARLDAAERIGEREQIEKIVSQLNDVLSIVNHKIRFRVSDSSHRIQIQILDPATGEVVKTIPPDRARNLGAALDELVGLIVDETR